jgi:hypothetical protein
VSKQQRLAVWRYFLHFQATKNNTDSGHKKISTVILYYCYLLTVSGAKIVNKNNMRLCNTFIRSSDISMGLFVLLYLFTYRVNIIVNNC